MSFALPSVKVKPEHPQNVSCSTGSFGVPELMTGGFSTSQAIEGSHPLITSERNYHKNRDVMNMTILRNTQGLHAPLRISMELKAAKQVGRLPFLQSSNIMHDVLTGRDLEIGPEDVYNTAEFRETMGQPHAMIEKSLGIL
ncbi:hypothetical protein ILUMI_12581 [Ignelater luminosus]|uniref:Proteasome maturation protein n=1 Tax=Ignelater luminosus TaxID=2038154 RepID=A0A8K0GBN3_IGNLU|nr:hypothetical protein ILUMI_12581 [Ignelater luminosus]